VSHLVLSDLPGDSEGEILNKSDVPRDLVVSDVPLTVCQEVLVLRHRGVLQLEPGADLFPEEVVVDTDDLGIGNIRMLHQVLLDLSRVDVLSTADDQVL
jgi:hypothetical protein